MNAKDAAVFGKQKEANTKPAANTMNSMFTRPAQHAEERRISSPRELHIFVDKIDIKNPISQKENVNERTKIKVGTSVDYIRE